MDSQPSIPVNAYDLARTIAASAQPGEPRAVLFNAIVNALTAEPAVCDELGAMVAADWALGRPEDWK